jgi:hypothetical protein
MNPSRSNLPGACEAALDHIESDPLDLPAGTLDHLAACPSCSEARVHWLATLDVPVPLAPAGYFERLPARVLGKLPAPRTAARPRGFLAAAAAVLLLATAAGAFWAGRANQTPLVEASLPKAPADTREIDADAPFQEKDEILEPLQNLSPDEASALLKTLEHSDSKP